MFLKPFDHSIRKSLLVGEIFPWCKSLVSFSCGPFTSGIGPSNGPIKIPSSFFFFFFFFFGLESESKPKEMEFLQAARKIYFSGNSVL